MRNTHLLLFVISLCAGQALAHSDVLLRSDGSRVLVGAAFDIGMEEGPTTYDLDSRVFEGVLINPAAPTPPFGFDFERDEPGFYSAPGLPVGLDLPASADVSLALSEFSLTSGSDTAFYWDGVGAVDFQPLSAAQPGVAFTTAPAGPTPFGSTSAGAFFDDHPLFGLTGGAADGVYLVSPVVSVEGLLDSDPFLMVWLASSVLVDDETAELLEEAFEAYEEGGPNPVVGGVDFAFYEEAVEWAEALPEPTSAGIALVALLGAAVKRRR